MRAGHKDLGRDHIPCGETQLNAKENESTYSAGGGQLPATPVITRKTPPCGQRGSMETQPALRASVCLLAQTITAKFTNAGLSLQQRQQTSPSPLRAKPNHACSHPRSSGQAARPSCRQSESHARSKPQSEYCHGKPSCQTQRDELHTFCHSKQMRQSHGVQLLMHC